MGPAGPIVFSRRCRCNLLLRQPAVTAGQSMEFLRATCARQIFSPYFFLLGSRFALTAAHCDEQLFFFSGRLAFTESNSLNA